MLVQRFEPQGRRFTNFYYYYYDYLLLYICISIFRGCFILCMISQCLSLVLRRLPEKCKEGCRAKNKAISYKYRLAGRRRPLISCSKRETETMHRIIQPHTNVAWRNCLHFFPPGSKRERDRHREIMHRIIQPHTSVVWRNLPLNSPRSKRERELKLENFTRIIFQVQSKKN